MTWRTRLSLVLAALVALLGSVVPTAAAADELGISPDGISWAANLAEPLFDPAFRWVPGDSETATFWVRNQSQDAGTLDITLVTGPVETLIDTGDLSVAARIDDGPYTAARTAGEHRLVNQIDVPAGTRRQVTVKVDLDPESPNLSQDLRLDLAFQVSLTQSSTTVEPPGTPGGGGSTAGPGGLPGTGTVITPVMFLLAVLLVAVGTGLVGYGRRRVTRLEERPSHVQA